MRSVDDSELTDGDLRLMLRHRPRICCHGGAVKICPSGVSEPRVFWFAVVAAVGLRGRRCGTNVARGSSLSRLCHGVCRFDNLCHNISSGLRGGDSPVSILESSSVSDIGSEIG